MLPLKLVLQNQVGGRIPAFGFFIPLLSLFISVAVAWTVYQDAKARQNSSAGLWGTAVFLGFLFGFIPGIIAYGAYFYLVWGTEKSDEGESFDQDRILITNHPIIFSIFATFLLFYAFLILASLLNMV